MYNERLQGGGHRRNINDTEGKGGRIRTTSILSRCFKILESFLGYIKIRGRIRDLEIYQKLGLMHVHCTGEGIQSWKVLLDIEESYLTISIVESISEIKLADIDIGPHKRLMLVANWSPQPSCIGPRISLILADSILASMLPTSFGYSSGKAIGRISLLSLSDLGIAISLDSARK
jgi:hypothetical protein